MKPYTYTSDNPDADVSTERLSQILSACKWNFNKPPQMIPSNLVVDSPLTGNGSVGVALSGPPEELRFHFGKNDCWTYNARKIRNCATILPVGGIILDAPALRNGSYMVEQDIEKACLRGRFQNADTGLEFVAWMPRNRNLLVCELKNTGITKMELGLRQWAGDPQFGFLDKPENRALIGHAECWLTPCIDRFCGDIKMARIYDGLLSADDVRKEFSGDSTLPFYEFPPLSDTEEPLPLAVRLPRMKEESLTLSIWVCPTVAPGRRAERKATQPHGFTFNRNADVQFLLCKYDVFELKLLDGVPSLRVGRISANANKKLADGEWTHLAATFDGRNIKFYINGEPVSTIMPDHLYSGQDSNGNLWVRRDLDPDLPQGVSVALASAVHGTDIMVSPGQLQFSLPPDRKCFVLVALCSNRENENPTDAAIALLAKCNNQIIKHLQTEHKHWWNEFWKRSLVDIGDSLIHKYYYSAYYILACCCGGKKDVPPGLFGSWVTTDNPAWNGDFHLNYNYQAPWWGVFSGNRSELADSYDGPLLAYISNGKANAMAAGGKGIIYPVGIGPWGMIVTRSAWGQKSNAAYSLVNMVMRWEMTRDLNYLRTIAYPFALAVGDFWESFLCYEGSRYVIRGDSIHEGSGDDVNPLLSLALVRMLYDFLLETSETLQKDHLRREKWRHIRNNLSEFPTQERNGATVFRLSEEGMAWAGANSLELQHVFPGSAIGLGSDAKLIAIAHETLKQLAVWSDYNSFATFYTQAARLGYNPELVLSKLKEQLNSTHALPNGYIHYGGGGIETCGGITSAINEMLFQSHGGVIRLFPSWPKSRNAQFHQLRAVGAFLVSADIKDGLVSHCCIMSENGGQVKLINPWNNCPVEIIDLVNDKKVTHKIDSNGCIVFETEQSHSYIVKKRN